MEQKMPLTVLALASLVPQLGPLPPHPCAWKEYPDAWVIVFDDGRKLRFEKAGEGDLRSARRPGQETLAERSGSGGNQAVAPAEEHPSLPARRKLSRRGA